MAWPLFAAPVTPLAAAVEERVDAILSPWLNALDDVDLGLDTEDLLD